jgi:acetyl esterase/lipase
MPAFLTAALILGLVQAQSQNPAQQRRFQLPTDLRVERDVVYGKGGGSDLKLDVYRPREDSAKARPAAIFIHGGGWRAGNKFPPNPLVLDLARKGFVSLSIEYRLVPEVRFPGMVEDCKCAVRWLRAHAKEYGVDPTRIGVWGTSAGGHLAAMLGASGDVKELEGSGGWQKESSRVQAVVSCFGPTNMLTILPQRGVRGRPNAEEGLIGGAPDQLREMAAKASPVTYVSKDDPPFLFLHGESDSLVPPAQSKEMHDLLLKAGVSSQIKVFPGVGHSLNPEGRGMVVDFFVKQLKP